MKRVEQAIGLAFAAVALCCAIGIGSAFVYSVWTWALTPPCVYTVKGCE